MVILTNYAVLCKPANYQEKQQNKNNIFTESLYTVFIKHDKQELHFMK